MRSGGRGPARHQEVTRVAPSILEEVTTIIQSAQSGQIRVIGFGAIILFAADTGDAWALDWEDRTAVCLARNGEVLPVRIAETETSYSIEWTSSYEITDEIITFQDAAGRTASVQGYPTAVIERTEGHLERAKAKGAGIATSKRKA